MHRLYQHLLPKQLTYPSKVILKLILKISFLFLLAVIGSCKKENLYDDRKILIGTWDWVSSRGTPFCTTALNDTILSSGYPNQYSMEITKREKIFLLENSEVQEEDPIIVSSFNEISTVEGGFSFSIFTDQSLEDPILGTIYPDSLWIFGYWPKEFRSTICQGYENLFVRRN